MTMTAADLHIERRSLQVRALNGSRLEGYAAVFNAQSHDLGGFVESIRPGAFAASLRRRDDVLALVDHEKTARAILGRTSAGTLRLIEDEVGLRFSLDVADTVAGRDILESVGRGDVTGASFGFVVERDTWARSASPLRREIIEVRQLIDVSIVASPAYPQTVVSRRSEASRASRERRLRYLEILESGHGFSA